MFRFDIGEIIKQHSCSVGKDETGVELKTKLADMGGRLLVDCFKELTRALRTATPQPEDGITYGKTILYFYILFNIYVISNNILNSSIKY